MHDLKNILLAWISSGTTIFAAFADGNTLYVVSAIILPVILFTLGKTIDVMLQIYLNRRKPERGRAETRSSGGEQT